MSETHCRWVNFLVRKGPRRLARGRRRGAGEWHGGCKVPGQGPPESTRPLPQAVLYGGRHSTACGSGRVPLVKSDFATAVRRVVGTLPCRRCLSIMGAEKGENRCRPVSPTR